MKNRIISLFLSGLLMLIGVVFCSITVSAREETCSLTLHCLVNEDSAERAITGSEFAVIKIADCTVSADGEKPALDYSTIKRFGEYDCLWGKLTSSELHKRAEELAAAVSEGDYICRGTTDERGSVTLDMNGTGLYLVICTMKTDAEVSFSPFLISLPQIINGEVIYHVISSPKFECIHCISEPELPSQPEENSYRPFTGETGEALAALTVLSAVMLTLGGLLFLSLKRRDG